MIISKVFTNHDKSFIHSLILAYFGLSLSASDLSDNVYVSVILMGLVELPSIPYCIWFMDHWGRKPTLVFSFLMCGICCIAAAYCDGALKLALALIGIDILNNVT